MHLKSFDLDVLYFDIFLQWVLEVLENCSLNPHYVLNILLNVHLSYNNTYSRIFSRIYSQWSSFGSNDMNPYQIHFNPKKKKLKGRKKSGWNLVCNNMNILYAESREQWICKKQQSTITTEQFKMNWLLGLNGIYCHRLGLSCYAFNKMLFLFYTEWMST